MWHYECNGQPVGPVSEDAVKLLIREGVLARSTLVWKSGMSGWANADETDLFRYFDTPPPLAPKGDNVRRANETPQEDHSSRTASRETESKSASPYAETQSTRSEPAISSPLPSETNKRPYEIFAGVTKPLRGIVDHAQVAVIAVVLVLVVTVFADFASIGFIDQAFSGSFASDAELDRQATLVDTFTQYANLAYLIVFLWSAIVIGRWTYRAMKNLRGMGYETTVSPGWAVGWHFIPVALIWMPFRGMAQIWRGSVHGAPVGDTKLPSSMRIWWACWLLGNWASFAAFRTQQTGLATEDFEVVQAAMGLNILGSVLHIVSALLLLRIIKMVSRAQSEPRR